MTHPKVEIKNFDIETELTCRCGCGRYNYDDEFLIRAQAYRYMLKMAMRVTSGGRCKQHNKDEGGVDTSCHQCETKKATALDFTCNAMASAYDLACKSGLFNEVIWYTKKNIIHLGYDKNQKGNYFTKK
jgi:hypothetical protein